MADQRKERNRLQAWGSPGIMLGTVLLILVVALVLGVPVAKEAKALHCL